MFAKIKAICVLRASRNVIGPEGGVSSAALRRSGSLVLAGARPARPHGGARARGLLPSEHHADPTATATPWR